MVNKKKEPQRTRLRRNDIVQVISGQGGSGLKRRLGPGDDAKARQVRGKVLSIDRVKGRALVQGVKMVTKSQRASQDPQQPRDRFIQKDGIRLEKHEREGGRVKDRRIRVCKKCGKDIPERS